MRGLDNLYDGSERTEEINVRLAIPRNYRFFGKRIKRIKKLLYSHQGGLCFYCDVKLTPLELKMVYPLPPNYTTLEHLIPRASSKHQRDYRLNNLVLACPTCNFEKGAKNWSEFYLSKNPIRHERGGNIATTEALREVVEAGRLHYRRYEAENRQPIFLQGLAHSGDGLTGDPSPPVVNQDEGSEVRGLRVGQGPDAGPHHTEESWWEEWPEKQAAPVPEVQREEG